MVTLKYRLTDSAENLVITRQFKDLNAALDWAERQGNNVMVIEMVTEGAAAISKAEWQNCTCLEGNNPDSLHHSIYCPQYIPGSREQLIAKAEGRHE